MMTFRILAAALMTGVLATPAHAAPTCLLEVDGQRYIDGACTVHWEGNGGFLMRQPNGSQAALARADFIGDHGEAFWNKI